MMISREQDRDFVLGLLIGAGVGLALALLWGSTRPQARVAPLERARNASRGPSRWPARRNTRAGRAIDRQIDRMRSAGL